jgi:REP element-mobilizing transposase RayT
MPRGARDALGGYCYHVINRGNGRRTVFHKEADFAAFAKLLCEAGERTDVRLLAYCLLGNHFHLLLWPRHDGDLSDYMMWLVRCRMGWIGCPMSTSRRPRRKWKRCGNAFAAVGLMGTPVGRSGLPGAWVWKPVCVRGVGRRKSLRKGQHYFSQQTINVPFYEVAFVKSQVGFWFSSVYERTSDAVVGCVSFWAKLQILARLFPVTSLNETSCRRALDWRLRWWDADMP